MKKRFLHSMALCLSTAFVLSAVSACGGVEASLREISLQAARPALIRRPVPQRAELAIQ